MVQLNFLISALAALFPLVFGMIWYNQKLFGNAWMKAAGLTEADSKKLNMPLVFGLTFFFSYLIALSLHFITIHQFGLQSLIAVPEQANPIAGGQEEFTRLMEIYGHSFRTFHHGVIHGMIVGIFLTLPMIAINGMFELKSWKYILINAGYWIICFAVMGGIVCQFG